MNCAAPFALTCPECGTELPPQAKFCYNCAAQVAVPTPGPSEGVAQRLQRLVPREFAERLLATRGQMVGERRIVTMLFSDVKGSTPMAERLDPEDVLEIMDGAFDVLIEPITRYEGALARLMGDGILAFFGAPIAHEDDAERACRAALEILEGARGYAAQLETERGIAGFNVRVGIHTGLVVVGEVGSDLRVEYTAMGDAVNLAARMEEAAEPGTVLITEDTHRLVAPLFEMEGLGPVEVRGRAEPASVYRVLAARAVVGKPRGIEGLESPLVGRDAEFRALSEVLKRLQVGVGGIVTIVGEAGIGKSRLVTELRKEAAPLGVRWVEGRCLSYGESMAYLPWVEMLHGLLGVSAEDPPAEVRDLLRRWVEGLCPDQVDEVYPFLGRMMSLSLEEDAVERLRGVEPEGMKVLTFRAVETALEAGTGEGPVVLVVEDLHWADASSLELLERALALTDRCSLLIICALRPYTEHGCWAVREAIVRLYRHRHTDLWLQPLSALDSEALVANLLHVEALPHPLRMRILDHAEGNPFYVEEVIRSLIDGGAIVFDEGMEQWVATRRVEDIAIPDTLQGVLVARIDRLEEDARRVLQMASVIGRIFHYRVLAAIAEGQHLVEEARSELHTHLSTLQREEMIREQARVPELEYIFKHHLTEQAAYNGLLRRERRLFHRQVAEALEALFPDRIEEQLGLLAHHWEQAGKTRRAIEYLRCAGEQAAAHFANEETVRYFSRALDLTSEEDLVERYDLLLAREAVCDLQGAREAQTQDLVALEALAAALGEDRRLAEVALRRARYGTQTSDYPTAVTAAREAADLAHGAGDTYLETSAYLQSGRVLRSLAEYEASEHALDRALSLARSAAWPRLEAQCLLELGVVFRYQGAYGRCSWYCGQALRLSRERGEQDTEANALLEMGGALLRQGEYDNAFEHLQESLRIFRQLGDRHYEAFALFSLGTARLVLGDYDGARLYYEQFLSIVRQTQHARGISYGLSHLAWVSQRLGDREQAREYAQEGLRVGAEVDDRYVQAWALAALGYALCDLARLDEATQAFRKARELQKALRQHHAAMNCMAGLAHVSLIQGDLAAAQARVEEILYHLEAGDLAWWWEPVRIYLTCYRVLRAIGDPRADDVLENGYRLFQDRAANISDEEEQRSYMENVDANREIVSEYAARRRDVAASQGD